MNLGVFFRSVAQLVRAPARHAGGPQFESGHSYQNFHTTLIRIFKQFFWIYCLATISLTITHYIGSYLPFWAKDLADSLFAGNEISVYKFLLLAGGIILFRTLSRYLFFYPARVLQLDLKLEMIQKLEMISPFRFKEYSKGQIYQTLNNDFDLFRAIFGFVVFQVSNIVIAVSILLPRLYNVHPKLLIALIPMFVMLLIFSIIVWRQREFFRMAQDLRGDVQNRIIESYNGKQSITNYGVEDTFISSFTKTSAEELNFLFLGGKRIAILKPIIPLGVGMSLLYGSYIIRELDLGVSYLILFSGFIFLFLEPLILISWIGIIISRAKGALGRINGFNKSLNRISEEEIKFKNEKELMFIPKKGSWCVIFGKTGCGKSHNLTAIAQYLKNQGESFSYVAQTPYLYNDTFLANILLGREGNGPQELDLIYDLTKIFDLTNLAETRETLFNLEIGENGKKLSGGEAKRLALIRSIINQAPYMIWDDPFSSVDIHKEREIIQKLKQIKNVDLSTLIISSHRLSTVLMMDDYIYLGYREEGIIEQGSVNSLMEDEKKANEFFKYQME